ncbi:hypothetical protein GCM10017608_30340 [Agromyces luteolus]|nr:hypothetical protein GCM10017608_30340 [Agromyces luteolus]
MRTAAVDRTAPLVRALLLGTGLAAAWIVVSLVASPSSASADDRPNGLLGTVGSVVGVVDGTVDGVVEQVVDPVLEPVAATVDTVTNTVTDAAPAPPAPVAPVVEQAAEPVETLVPAVGGAVDTVDDTVAEVAAEAGSLVSDIAGDAPVGTITAPVVGTLDGVVGSLPVVGSLLGDDALGGVLGPVVGAVDDTLDVVIGDLGPLPDDGLVPSLPLPGDPESPIAVVPPIGTGDPTGADAASVRPEDDLGPRATVDGGAAEPSLVTSAAATDLGPPGDPPGTLAPANAPRGAEAPLGSGAPASGSSASGSGSGTASGSDAGLGSIELDALASLVLSAVDDALPSSPVYETDTTPD